MTKQVQIPLWLFQKTLDFLEILNSSSCGAPFRENVAELLTAFRNKAHAIELRSSYAKIIFAQDDESRFDARMQYLLNRRL